MTRLPLCLAEKNTTAEKPVIRVTLLGTGVPTPIMERFGPATLVEAGGEILLFDAGRGVLQRLYQLKVPLKNLRSVFFNPPAFRPYRGTAGPVADGMAYRAPGNTVTRVGPEGYSIDDGPPGRSIPV